MKHPEPLRDRPDNDGEITVNKNINEKFYSVFYFTIAESGQTTVKPCEGVGEEGLGDGPRA